MDFYIDDGHMWKLDVLADAYDADWEEMLYWMINEAYANMWKDVNKEKYDDYKG